jgi:uncharacterized protein (DUF1015 family)
MAVISPFRAWRYNKDLIPEQKAVTAPPYDVIDPNYQRELYDRHRFNVIRMILGEILPDDDVGENRYTRAAAYRKDWQVEGVLKAEDRPSIYLYQTVFQDPEGRTLTRKGFVALIRLEAFDAGVVFPHEETFPKHKADRLMLMRECRTHFSPILSLIPDSRGRIEPLLETPGDAPDERVVDDDGVVHELWVVRDEDAIRNLVKAMEDEPVYIADGHHRYETCLKYREERSAEGDPEDSSAPYHWTLMYFTPMEDDGLVIFPTHKLVSDLDGFAADGFVRKLKKDYDVREIPFENANVEQARVEFQQALKEEGRDRCAIGLAVSKEPVLRILTPKDHASLIARMSSVPECVRDLEVTLLHEMIFRRCLRIDVSDPKDRHLSFSHDMNESLDRAYNGEIELAFIMNPTRISDLKAVAGAGCKMPQKATYFYPKLLSGFVMNIMEEGE